MTDARRPNSRPKTRRRMPPPPKRWSAPRCMQTPACGGRRPCVRTLTPTQDMAGLSPSVGDVDPSVVARIPARRNGRSGRAGAARGAQEPEVAVLGHRGADGDRRGGRAGGAAAHRRGRDGRAGRKTAGHPGAGLDRQGSRSGRTGHREGTGIEGQLAAVRGRIRAREARLTRSRQAAGDGGCRRQRVSGLSRSWALAQSIG